MKYDYQCEEHGYFEIECSMHDTKPVWECPYCGKPSKKVFLHPPALEFRGGDWASKKPKKIKDPTGRDWKGKGEGYI